MKYIFAVFIAITVIIIWISHQSALQWLNCRGLFNPTKAFEHETKRIGTPDMLDTGPGGLAVWRRDTLRKQQLPLCEVVLRDELVPHEFPTPHNDFLYATYRLSVPDDKVYDVIRLSDSVFYDTLKCEITVRCQSLGAIFATLYLASLVADGTLSIDVAKNMYGRAVSQTMPGDPSYNPDAEQTYINHLSEKLD